MLFKEFDHFKMFKCSERITIINYYSHGHICRDIYYLELRAANSLDGLTILAILYKIYVTSFITNN